MATPDTTREASQTTQRVRVGMIGLAAVLLLIGLAAAIFATASRERQQAAVAGAANAQVVANMVSADGNDAATAKEPLAELGVAPSASGDTNGTDAIDNRTASRTR